MYRQSPSRNQRSKGVKVKHVLQICLLLAVCFWLIYQVKHSHDKRKEFDESDAKVSHQRESSDEFIKLGRKDLDPRVERTIPKNEKNDEPVEEEEIIGEEVDENKHEDDEPEDKKVEGKEDEEIGGGEAEMDENEEKPDVEVDREEDLVDDEKERENGDENETQETDTEDDHGEMEKERSVEDNDHDGDERSVHEAREEHYKADDASSAVTHDTQIATTENENEHVENSKEHPENIEENKENNGEESNKDENRKDLELGGGEMARDSNVTASENGSSLNNTVTEGLNVTTSETNIDMLDNPENSSPPNGTLTEGFSDHLTSNSSTEVTTEDHDLTSQNVTKSEPELDHGQGILTKVSSVEGSNLEATALELANNSTLNIDNSHFYSNSTGSAESNNAESHSEEFSNSSNNITESSSEKKVETEAEKSDLSNDTEENLESTVTENPEEVQHEGIDASDTANTEEEKDGRVDLDTLPEIQTEGTNNEDAAVE
ncbi:hypothetical protein CDL12_11143 [Handroanthus impetiginosus]|uniref:Ubiquitinyl hydrolase 1 n=1 Tax=Handroanthus impetiginosus TaxID=429701 RepID=A0A2G9HF91_9LAMI|nr:hypothetical protein CDL12_11143 [Handroanthus impetiginosus]